jgi:hypothetical protein
MNLPPGRNTPPAIRHPIAEFFLPGRAKFRRVTERLPECWLMQFEFSLKPEEYSLAMGAVLGSINKTNSHKLWIKRVKYIVYIYCIFFFVATITAVMYFPESRIHLLIFALIILAAQETARWSIDRFTKVAYGSTYDARRFTNVEAVFGEAEIEQTGAEHRQTWKWTLLNQLHDLPGIYVLEFAGFDMLAIPKRLLRSPDEEQSWLDTVRRHIDQNRRA